MPTRLISATQPTKIVCIHEFSFMPVEPLLPTICSGLGAKHDILLVTCRVLRGLSLSRRLSSSHCISSCWASPTLQPVPSCQASSLPLPLVACLAAGLETSKLLARAFARMHCTAACDPCKMLFRSHLHFFRVGNAPSSVICTTPCI